MTAKQNQHFVPQYYFRGFSQCDKSIMMLLKRSGEVKKDVAIKKQASKANFYGNPAVEDKVTPYDTKYSAILSNAIENVKENNFTVDSYLGLMEAVCFQKLRTLDHRQSNAPLMDFYSDFYEPQVNDIDNYDSGISEEATALVNNAMRGGIDALCDGQSRQVYDMFNVSEELTELHDLNAVFLNNISGIPLIFSDTPVVPFNIALKDYSCSKLGNTNAGLIIYYPINCNTAFILFDNDAYNLLPEDLNVINICNKADIDALNKLQIHSAVNSVYFGDFKYKDYVYELWKSETHNLKKTSGSVELLEELTLDGYITGRKVYSLIEEDPIFIPELTFLSAKSVLNENIFPYRKAFVSILPDEVGQYSRGRVDIEIDKKIT